MAHTNSVLTSKVSAVLSLLLSIYGTFRYTIGTHSPFGDDTPLRIGYTPYSPSVFFIYIYWIALYILQIAFILQFYLPETSSYLPSFSIESATSSTINVQTTVGWHFTLFNILSFFWSFFSARGHFIISELFVIFNFFNIIILYLTQKTYSIKPLSRWVLIHLPTAAMPFSWLFYLIFWNGALMIHAGTGLAARITANVFIWDFLIVPGLFLVIHNDWAVGFSTSVLMFALGWGQLSYKVIALQWIFAFVISGLLALFSLAAAFNVLKKTRNDIEANSSSSAEQAPLLTE